MQNHIDFLQHDSSTIFSSIINKVRLFCIKETKAIGNKRKEAEKSAISFFIAAREALNNSPLDADLIDAYEAAQQKLQILQTRRHQSATERNYSNYATLGKEHPNTTSQGVTGGNHPGRSPDS